jgi:hypothetical protein
MSIAASVHLSYRGDGDGGRAELNAVISVDGRKRKIARARVAAGGSEDLSLAIPVNLPAGSHYVTLQLEASDFSGEIYAGPAKLRAQIG